MGRHGGRDRPPLQRPARLRPRRLLRRLRRRAARRARGRGHAAAAAAARRPLSVGREGDGVALHDGDELIAEARPVELIVEGPPPVDPGVAAAASARFEWQDDHPFPTCFGCGPDRDPSDALCLFTGPVGDGRFAVPWTPPAWSGDGTVDPLFVWAALDCPSSAPVHPTLSAPIVLGRFSVALEGPVEVGAPHVIQSWLEHMERRKYQTAVALWTAGGERRAIARAVWIELAKPL